MPCYGPLWGYYSRELNAGGKRSIVFDKRKSFSGVPVMIPCGECIGCRLNWRRQWAIRCMHEKRMYSASAFVTLTYADKHLPTPASLSLRSLQLFMKRFRKVRPVGIRFFACGEYGDAFKRPHYHILFFNTDFPDQRFWKNSEAGEMLFKSAELRELWPFGENVIGSLTCRSAAYVCGYVLKKVGKPSVDVVGFEPEFRVMSRRPGIGFAWYERFKDEAYRHDSVVLNYSEVGIPRYYDTKFDLVNHDLLLELKRKRKFESMFLHSEDNTKERLYVREQVEVLKQARFSRDVG